MTLGVRTFPLLAALAAFSLIVPASAATPVPGGANQVHAVSGKVGDTLFNGVVRIKVVELRDATSADHPEQMLPAANQKVMIMTVLIRNGLHRSFAELVSYTLADKDDVTFAIPGYTVKPNPLNIAQAGAARQTALFNVDKNYVPVKLLVQCDTCNKAAHFKPFRINVTTGGGR